MPKRIVKLAGAGDADSITSALELCRWGRELSEIEDAVRTYYAHLALMKQILSFPKAAQKALRFQTPFGERKMTILQACQTMVVTIEKILSQYFILATFQSPFSHGRNTGQECPANPQTRMSALHERWKRSRQELLVKLGGINYTSHFG